MQHESSVAAARREALGGSAMAGIFGSTGRVKTATERDAPYVDRWETASQHAQRPMSSASQNPKLSLPGVHATTGHTGSRTDLFSPIKHGSDSSGQRVLTPQQQYALDLQQQIAEKKLYKQRQQEQQQSSRRVSTLRQTVQNSRALTARSGIDTARSQLDTARSQLDTARSRMLSGSAMASCLGGAHTNVRGRDDAFGGMLPTRARPSTTPLQPRSDPRHQQQLILQQEHQEQVQEQKEHEMLLLRQQEQQQQQQQTTTIQQQQKLLLQQQQHQPGGDVDMRAELEYLRIENVKLKDTNVEMRHILDRYYALYGPLPPQP